MRNATIIIPTYKNVKYIDDALSSVISALGPEGEALVGIDACQDTMSHVLSRGYDPRIRFFMFSENSGPYVVKNSLVGIAASENIVFFDSDDVMLECMVEDMCRILEESDAARSMYRDFADGEDLSGLSSTFLPKYADGVFGVKKSVFLSMNGFEPWKCGADTEFKRRLYKGGFKEVKVKRLCFLRRKHSSSLTASPETGFSSDVRARYSQMIWEKKDFGPLPELAVADFQEIFPAG